jgi:hypothetical protein
MRLISVPLILLLVWLLPTGCQEEFQDSPPFTGVQDSVFLDIDNWYYLGQDPVEMDGALLFPFSYQIFDSKFDGYLFSSSTRIYVLERGKSLRDRSVFLDQSAVPGDTLAKLSSLQYQVLIDKQRSTDGSSEMFYIMRRSRIGMKTQRERSLWVVSPTEGIVSVAKYDIDPMIGQVTMDMLGDYTYFREPELVRRIKYYDNHLTWMIDREREIIYEFHKLRSTLKSRNFGQGEDLYEYRFKQTKTQDWVDFSLFLDRDQIRLKAGDSCFFFSQELELIRSGLCN